MWESNGVILNEKVSAMTGLCSCFAGQQLSLQLCFINFHTGGKVALTLDVTCLNSGVYPSEILPYEVQDPKTDSQKSRPVENEIRSAAENLEVGYMRILRLCRCVSQVLQASSM
ncbi:hypothetical protein CsatB_016296 [Cannabis sativa]